MSTLFLLTIAITAVTLAAIQQSALTFDHYSITVDNLDTSASFYKEILQLPEIENKTQKKTIRWFSMGSHAELHLIEGSTEEISVIQRLHLALTSNNLDALMERLREHNIPFGGAHGEPNFNTRADGIRQIFFQDPDGYWIEVNDLS